MHRVRPADLRDPTADTRFGSERSHGAGGRDVAAIVAAEALLRHGLSDADVLVWLARTWPLDNHSCQAALATAHAFRRANESVPHAPEEHPSTGRYR